ncbi:hypothetical protein ZHAS_00006017 [Anopheles sinensis]|uniref:Uncharacterized protein n=1 Tax=Anopheles sinensis TaxID=74873 RepID=A0A084VKY6_ANOSI|nr:hypothetical protein ZHAS_00006017 [Anopheles sinensis]
MASEITATNCPRTWNLESGPRDLPPPPGRPALPGLISDRTLLPVPLSSWWSSGLQPGVAQHLVGISDLHMPEPLRDKASSGALPASGK